MYLFISIMFCCASGRDEEKENEEKEKLLIKNQQIQKQIQKQDAIDFANHLFEACDSNGDGTVSRIDLIKVLRKDGAVARALELSEGSKMKIKQQNGQNKVLILFNTLDQDGDGKLSKAEVEAWCIHKSKSLRSATGQALLPHDLERAIVVFKAHKAAKETSGLDWEGVCECVSRGEM